MKILRNSAIFTLFSFLISGCTGSQQPTIQSNANIQSLKEFIMLKRVNETGAYDIIAEKSNQTILEYRTYDEQVKLSDATDIMKILGDAKEYCEYISGISIYGDQAIKEIKQRPTSFSIDYIGYKNDMQKQGVGQYNGFYKCASNKDGFEIEYMKDNIELQQKDMLGSKRDVTQNYSRYYLTTHKKPQNTEYKFWNKSNKYKEFVSNNNTPEKVFNVSDVNTKFDWKYEKVSNAQKYCSFNGGKLYIANAINSYHKMGIEDYYFTRLEQIKNTPSINIFMDTDYIWCENEKSKEKEFTLIHNGSSVEYKKGFSTSYLPK